MPPITRKTDLKVGDRVLNKKSGAVAKITKVATRTDGRFTLENVETLRTSRPTIDTLIKQYRVGTPVNVVESPDGIDISERAADFVTTEPQVDREAFDDETYVPGDSAASLEPSTRIHALLFSAGFVSGAASGAIIAGLVIT